MDQAEGMPLSGTSPVSCIALITSSPHPRVEEPVRPCGFTHRWTSFPRDLSSIEVRPSQDLNVRLSTTRIRGHARSSILRCDTSRRPRLSRIALGRCVVERVRAGARGCPDSRGAMNYLFFVTNPTLSLLYTVIT
jgi:hypothetical protein